MYLSHGVQRASIVEFERHIDGAAKAFTGYAKEVHGSREAVASKPYLDAASSGVKGATAQLISADLFKERAEKGCTGTRRGPFTLFLSAVLSTASVLVPVGIVVANIFNKPTEDNSTALLFATGVAAAFVSYTGYLAVSVTKKMTRMAEVLLMRPESIATAEAQRKYLEASDNLDNAVRFGKEAERAVAFTALRKAWENLSSDQRELIDIDQEIQKFLSALPDTSRIKQAYKELDAAVYHLNGKQDPNESLIPGTVADPRVNFGTLWTRLEEKLGTTLGFLDKQDLDGNVIRHSRSGAEVTVKPRDMFSTASSSSSGNEFFNDQVPLSSSSASVSTPNLSSRSVSFNPAGEGVSEAGRCRTILARLWSWVPSVPFLRRNAAQTTENPAKEVANPKSLSGSFADVTGSNDSSYAKSPSFGQPDPQTT